METGLTFTLVYQDDHLMELRVAICNAMFAGTADVYVSKEQLKEIAQRIDGFPQSVLDEREALIGAPSSNFAGGTVSFRFQSKNSVGHSFIEARVQSASDKAGRSQSANVFMSIEPSGVDEFVKELRQMAMGKSQTAHLRAQSNS